MHLWDLNINCLNMRASCKNAHQEEWADVGGGLIATFDMIKL